MARYVDSASPLAQFSPVRFVSLLTSSPTILIEDEDDLGRSKVHALRLKVHSIQCGYVRDSSRKQIQNIDRQQNLPAMNNSKQTTKTHQRLKAGAASLLALACAASAHAYTDGRVTFASDAPFAGGYAHSMSANTAEDLFSVAGWADAAATTPANLWNWWILLGVDSGVGNGALVDGTESVTIQLDKSVGTAMLFFTYTGGNGSGSGNLARLSISGFSADPGASCVPTSVQRITAISYSGGVLSFDYLDDGGGADTGQLILANPVASAGRNLELTVAASPNGNATAAFAALRAMTIQEAYAGPQVQPSYIGNNVSSSYTSADGKLTIALPAKSVVVLTLE